MAHMGWLWRSARLPKLQQKGHRPKNQTLQLQQSRLWCPSALHLSNTVLPERGRGGQTQGEMGLVHTIIRQRMCSDTVGAHSSWGPHGCSAVHIQGALPFLLTGGSWKGEWGLPQGRCMVKVWSCGCPWCRPGDTLQPSLQDSPIPQPHSYSLGKSTEHPQMVSLQFKWL